MSPLGQEAEGQGFLLAEELRDAYPDLSIEMNLNGGNFKQQFKRADKAGSDIALILGDDEIRATNCWSQTHAIGRISRDC